MSSKENSSAKPYQEIKYRVFYFSLALDIALLIFFQLSGWSALLRSWALSLASAAWVMNAIYLFVFSLVGYVIHLPLDYFTGYHWEHRFDLSTQKWGDWLKDSLKKAGLNFLFVLIIVEIIYTLLGRFPQHWWLGAAFAWLILSVVLARIFPNVIIPLFYKYVKIENEQLRQSIAALFEKCRVNLQDVTMIDFSAKTKKANAFVCGLGNKRRVVLSDTLVANFTIPEIEVVVAHELGHYKHRDIAKFLVVNTVFVLVAFYVADRSLEYVLARLGNLQIADIATLPLFALTMGALGFLSAPVLNAFSRFLEVKADAFSLQLTENPQAFITMMRKLGEMNLVEWEPSRFREIMFYDHPSLTKRIKFAEGFLRK